MKLFDLPSEDLSIILAHVTASNVTRLWLCGCPTLNLKLGKGNGVRDFDLTFSARQKFVFPSILASFPQLRSLRLVFGLNRHVANVPRVAFPIDGFSWLNIPKQLLNLELEFPTVSYLSVPLTCHTFDNMLELKLSVLHPYYTIVPEVAPFDWKHFFPNLRLLDWNCAKRNVLFSLRHLPTSLTTLRVAAHSLKDWEAPLPVGLTSLRLNLNTVESAPENAFSGLTANLRELWVATSLELGLSKPLTAIIPKLVNLETLYAPLENVNGKLLSMLPRTLKSLDLPYGVLESRTEDGALESVKGAPKFLEHLHLPSFRGKWSPEKEALYFELLPRTLTGGLYGLLNPTFLVSKPDHMDKLPTSLISLQTSVPLSQLQTQLQNPERLKALKELIIFCPILEDIRLLPRSLTSLQLRGGESYFPHHLLRLPELLPHLISFFNYLEPLQTNNKAAVEQEFAYLPRTLQSLVQRAKWCRCQNARNLPPTLTKLILSDVKVIDKDWTKDLPTTLTAVDLTFDLPEFSSFEAFNFQHLRQLRTLELFGSTIKSSKYFHYEDLFKILPPQLQQLSIAFTFATPIFEAKHLASLPQALVSLHTFLDDEPEQECIQYLPPCLIAFVNQDEPIYWFEEYVLTKLGRN